MKFMPSNAAYPGFQFEVRNATLYIGLFNLHPEREDETLTPLLLERISGNDWKEVDRYDTLWDDVQTEIYPDPEKAAQSILNNFNKTIETISGGVAMTWNQKLAGIFRLRLELVEELLAIKEG